MNESIKLTAPEAGHVAEKERICERFEAALRGGERPPIENELPALPGPARTVLLSELIALKLAYRRRVGEQPEAAEYLGRFPDASWAVHAALRTSEPGTLAVEAAASGSSPPDGTASTRPIRFIAAPPTPSATQGRLDIPITCRCSTTTPCSSRPARTWPAWR